jgi:hypothetical protein
MSLYLATIGESSDEDRLFKLISDELAMCFPKKRQQNPTRFWAALAKAPRGLRAMAAVYDLDINLTSEDLAGHFVNHHDDRFLNETALGLKELEASEMADIFLAAWSVLKPQLAEIRKMNWKDTSLSDYFEESGVHAQQDPLNGRAWKICGSMGRLGLAEYWILYARKYPEPCLDPS